MGESGVLKAQKNSPTKSRRSVSLRLDEGQGARGKGQGT